MTKHKDGLTMTEAFAEDAANEPIPGPDQGEQAPYTTEPIPTEPDLGAIFAALIAADDAVRKAHGGGEPGAGIKALLALVAAQLGVKLT